MPLDDADKKFIAEAIAGSLKPETIGAAVKAHLDGLKLDDKIAEGIKAATKDLPKADPKDDKDKDADKGKWYGVMVGIKGLRKAAQRQADAENSVYWTEFLQRDAKQYTDQAHAVVYECILRDTQTEPIWVSPALVLLHGWDFTCDAIAGTITVNWSIRQIS